MDIITKTIEDARIFREIMFREKSQEKDKCILEILAKAEKRTNDRILTDRELEYLTFTCLGFKNSEIADILMVSNSTVKKMLETVFKKLRANDRASAVALGFLYGVLDVSTIDLIYERHIELVKEICLKKALTAFRFW